MATLTRPSAKSRTAVARKGKRATHGKSAKPDMKAFAARRLARMKEIFGDRVTPSSHALWEDLRSDASCPSALIPAC